MFSKSAGGNQHAVVELDSEKRDGVLLKVGIPRYMRFGSTRSFGNIMVLGIVNRSHRTWATAVLLNRKHYLILYVMFYWSRHQVYEDNNMLCSVIANDVSDQTY